MEKEFYMVIRVKSKKNEDGSVTVKDFVETYKGSRLVANRELTRRAKAVKGEIVYFGAFKN